MIWCVKTYTIAYVETQKKRFINHYVKPTAQLLFKIRFPKGGPTLLVTYFTAVNLDFLLPNVMFRLGCCWL